MKNFKKLLSNQQGMSLIELTVAAAVSVIISMGVVKTTQIGQKGMTKISTDLDLKMWQQQRLMQVLGEPGACAYTFPGHSIDLSSIISEIRDSENNVVYSAGDDIEGGAWTIVSMAIVGVPAADISDAVNKYTTNFEISMSRKNSESYGAKVRKIFVPIVLVRASDPSTTLISCSAGSVGADGLWNQELANGGYIHSVSKNVIIGSNGSTPRAPFQIDINSSSEWPGDTLNDVFPAMKISNRGDAIVFGTGSGSGALYQSTTGNCLTMGSGASGDITSKIESCYDPVTTYSGIKMGDEGGNLSGPNAMILNSTISTAQGDHSIVLGGSATISKGAYSIAAGRQSTASGDYSFSSGYNTTATGLGSSSFGGMGLVSGQYAFGAGYNSHAYGRGAISLGSSSLARGDYSIAIGNYSIADGLYSLAFGRSARSTYPESMVLSGSGTATYSTNASQFTAKFNNGFKFIASNASYPSGSAAVDANSEDSGVFIDPNGNMGLGSDLSQSPTSSFTEDRTPKLFVNGDVEIFGDLYVNGNKVGAELTWTNIASVNIYHRCSNCRVTRDSTSRVQLNGLLIASALPPACYLETSNILVLPVGKRPDRTLRFLVPHGATGTKILLIYSNGNVRMQGGNCNSANSIPLDGISFYGTI